jgi:hypothetical protein
VWIVGHSNSNSEGDVLSNSISWEQSHEQSNSFHQGGKEESPIEHTNNGNVFDTGPSEDTWWKNESKLRGVPHGVSTELDPNRNKRIKALGNAILPLIPFYIGRAISQTYTL